MEERSTLHLRLPRGTESLILEEAARQRLLSHRLEQLYDRWGYLPAQTPIVDFAELYQPLLPEESSRQAYRLIDREGELLMLRADITLFLAKQLGMRLSNEELPVRVCYSDAILRHEERHDISKNEFFQSGAELIGVPGVDGDLEALLLLEEALEASGAKSYALHLGSSALLRATASGLTEAVPAKSNLPWRQGEKDITEALRDTVLGRNFQAMDELLKESGTDQQRREALTVLYRSVGSPEEIRRVLGSTRRVLQPSEIDAVDYLLSLGEKLLALGETGENAPVRLDLSEVGSRSYYTGIAFQAYVDRLDGAIASGGRYDSLLAFFGFSAPSVGFSLLPRKIASLSRKRHQLEDVEQAEGGSFEERYRRAQEARRLGRRVHL